MKPSPQNHWIFLIFVAFVFHFETVLATKCGGVEIKGQSVCYYCAEAVHREISNRQKDSAESIFILSNDRIVKDIEIRALNNILGRIENKSSFATSFFLAAFATKKVDFHLYYQFSIDKLSGQTALNSRTTTLSLWESEAQINHELWGYYKFVGDRAQILLNEYQYPWNAEYTLVHEVFHLLDKKSDDYLKLDYVHSSLEQNQRLHPLDDFALEFRAILAEIYYRKDVVSHETYGSNPMEKCDFRNKFIESSWRSKKNRIDVDAALEYALELYFPISEATLATKIIAPLQTDESSRAATEKTGLQIFVSAVDQLIENFFTSKKTQVQGAQYQVMSLQSRIEKFRREREVIFEEVKKRGFKDLKDYLSKSGLLEPIDENSVRKDGFLNRIPFKNGGPSPRVGGGGA